MSMRRSLSWAFSGQFANFAVQFAGSVVIARLLSPAEMGIVAIAMAGFGIVAVLTTFGVGSYVIKDVELRAETLETAFTVNALLTCILSLMLFLLSLGAGPVLGEPRAADVLHVVAFSNLVGILGFRPSVMMQREMRFKRLSAIGVASSIISTLLVVVFAAAGFSYMSAAWGGLIAAVINTGLTLFMGRHHAGYRLSLANWRPMTTFGLQIMSIGGVAVLVGRLCDLILSRSLGVAALGLYQRANSLSGQIFENVYGVATRVLFVQLSKDMRETGEIHTTFVRAMKIITALMWPFLAGLAILSRPAVLLLYGERWLPSAGPLTLLLIAQIVTLGFGLNWELFVLRGETARQVKYEMTRSVSGLVLFSLGTLISLSAAAASRVADSLIGLFLYAPQVRRLAGTQPYEMLHVYAQSAALTVAAAAPVLGVMIAYDWSSYTPLAAIFPAVATGVVLWTVALKLLCHPLWDELMALTRRRAPHRAAPFRDGADRGQLAVDDRPD